MRGSPLVRFLLLALLHALGALGLLRLTNAQRRDAQVPETSTDKNFALATASFHLQLSALNAQVTITPSNGEKATSAVKNGALSGTLLLEPRDPKFSLFIQWESPPVAGESRFVKLTVDPPGAPTFSCYFDAPGDIDEAVELPPFLATHE